MLALEGSTEANILKNLSPRLRSTFGWWVASTNLGNAFSCDTVEHTSPTSPKNAFSNLGLI